MKRVIIDADPGIDDTAAILLALASPELEVVAVTTIFGNASVEDCTANAHRVLEGRWPEQHPGLHGRRQAAAAPGQRGRCFAHPRRRRPGGRCSVVGDSRGSPTAVAQDRHAVLAIAEAVMATPGELTILALGRMTNVALALSLEPRLASAVREIVVMGGGGHCAWQCIRRRHSQPARGPGGRSHRLPLRRAHRAGGAGTCVTG